MKNEEYAIFSEVNVDNVPSGVIIRDLPKANAKANVYAIVSFVFAILGIFPCLIILSAPVSLLGLLFAITALIKKTDKKGFAIAGLIINLLTLACSIAFMVFSTMVANSFIDIIKGFFASLF